MGVPDPASSIARRARRRTRFVAVAAIVTAAAMIALGSVFVAPPRSGGHAVLGPGVPSPFDVRDATFHDDLPAATSFVGNLSGGPYGLVAAQAVSTPVAIPEPLLGSGATACPLVPVPYASRASFLVPAADDLDGGGQGPEWTYDFLGADGNGVRVAVVNGTPMLLGQLAFDGPGCPPSERPNGTVGLVVDSGTAALAALGLGGTTFLSDNPSSRVTYTMRQGLEPGLGRTAAEWNVTYDSCPAVDTPGEQPFGAYLTLVFDAATTTLLQDLSGGVDCPPSTGAPIPFALSESLALNAPVVVGTGAMAYYNATVASVCCGLSGGNLSARLIGNDAATGTAPVLTLWGPNGSLLCDDRAAALANGSAIDCSAVLAPGDLLSLELPADGDGPGVLELSGVWDFQGSVYLPLAEATPLAGLVPAP